MNASATPMKSIGRRRELDGGFTLVEMLIVVVVLGILATVTVFAIRGITDRGEKASCKADYETVSRAATYYLAESGVQVIPATGAGDDRYERTLVDAKLLQSVSVYHDVDVDGMVTSSGVPCP